jgi:NAD(P)H dehydrogenase (quinone)
MAEALVLCYPGCGHVESMATAVAEGFQDAGTDVVAKRVADLVPDGITMTA